MEVFVWSIVFGIVGMGYFSFGRKRDEPLFLYSGIGLMVFPYVVEGLTYNILVGVGLCLLPFVMKRFG